jgi:ribonuclease BN (tRNA processing enzyme)
MPHIALRKRAGACGATLQSASMNRSRELAALLILCAAATAQTAPTATAVPKTHVVILGTGTPRLDPDRSGPAVCIVANGTPYLVDFGPGVVRRAAAAALKGVTGCAPTKIKVAFATHLHSDHTAGLSDLYLSPAVVGRGAALELYGPAGLRAMAEHIRVAYAKDIQVRTEGLEQGNRAAYELKVHEIKPGVVYKDANVTVTAFAVAHGSWDLALGFRFDTADRSIVISGDTAPTDAIAANCHGCDLLLHEVYSVSEIATPRAAERKTWPEYLRKFHTSTAELAAIAARAKPGILVLCHQIYGGGTDDDLVREVQQTYKGKVVSARDLDVY